MKRPFQKTGAIVLPLFLLFTAAGAYAQETNPEQTTDTAGAESVAVDNETAQTESSDFAATSTFHLDDPTIWVLIALFNLAVAVAVERSWILYKNRGNNKKLVSLLTEKLGASVAVDSVSREIAKDEYGLEGRVAAITLKGWRHGVHAMAEYAQSAMTAERKNLERRMVILSTLGANTPFIGLLGTVLGIMKAFRDLSVMGDGGPTVVMQGISAALIATAAGLAVAIPCVIAYNLLSRGVKTKLANADEIVSLIRAIRITVFHPNHSQSVGSPDLSGNGSREVAIGMSSLHEK